MPEQHEKEAPMVSANTSLKTLLEQRADEIEQITAGLSEEQASRKPAQSEWCARDVLTHLLGSEARSFADGVRQFLDDDAVLDLTPGDPYQTAAREKMTAQQLAAGVTRQIRQIADFVGTLTAEQLQRTAHVPFLKDYGINDHPTLETWAGMMANMHLRGHVDQLRSLAG
jgi:hypothetical protein